MPIHPIDRRILVAAFARVTPALALVAFAAGLPLPALLAGAAASLLSYRLLASSADALLARSAAAPTAPVPRAIARRLVLGNALRLALTAAVALLCARLSAAHLFAALAGLSAVPLTLVVYGAAGHLAEPARPGTAVRPSP